jgi:hypothetical protein
MDTKDLLDAEKTAAEKITLAETTSEGSAYNKALVDAGNAAGVAQTIAEGTTPPNTITNLEK